MTLRFLLILFLLLPLSVFHVFAFIWNAVLGAGAALGSLGSGLIGASAQDRANESNLGIAREQMSFQERMSGTAHQREVEDLRKAGLNPVLSAGGGGASAPSGAGATMVPGNPASGLPGAISSAMDMISFEKDLKQKDAQTVATVAAAKASEASAQNSQASAAATAADMPSVRARASSAQAEADLRKTRSSMDQKLAPIDAAINRILNGIGGVADVMSIRRVLEGIRGSKQRRQNEEMDRLDRAGDKGVLIRPHEGLVP